MTPRISQLSLLFQYHTRRDIGYCPSAVHFISVPPDTHRLLKYLALPSTFIWLIFHLSTSKSPIFLLRGERHLVNSPVLPAVYANAVLTT